MQRLVIHAIVSTVSNLSFQHDDLRSSGFGKVCAGLGRYGCDEAAKQCRAGLQCSGRFKLQNFAVTAAAAGEGVACKTA